MPGVWRLKGLRKTLMLVRDNGGEMSKFTTKFKIEGEPGNTIGLDSAE